MRIKLEIDYDLPEYDPTIHDPDRTYAFLTYRGVSYAKWVMLKSKGILSWKLTK
jgi:hypothetical protein